MCFGHNHPVTGELRRFKKTLLNYSLGIRFVEIYYRYSSQLVEKLEKHTITKSFVSMITKPILRLIAFLNSCLSKEVS